jgi:AraC family transcriptional regulator
MLEGGRTMDVRIEEKDAFTLVVKKKLFNLRTGSDDVPRYWSENVKGKFKPSKYKKVGVTELIEGTSAFYFGIGGRIRKTKSTPRGFEKMEIPKNTWAIFTERGPMPSAMQNLWKKIYTEFFPKSKYESVPEYELEVYSQGNPEDPDYKIEAWVPIRLKNVK